MAPTTTVTEAALERIDGAFALFRRVLEDAEFRDQLPDSGNVAIALRDGSEPLFAPGLDPQHARIVYHPDTGEATVLPG